MKKHWWKALAVLLLLYSFIVGMLIPLKPGIADVAPNNAKTGTPITLKIEGYNTFYTKAKTKEIRAWLKLDDEHLLGAKKLQVIGDQALEITFDIPLFLPTKRKVQDFTLLLDDPINGSSVLPSALFVTQDSIDLNRAKATWINAEISNLTGKTGTSYPFLNILLETIRNTYYHVPLWFAMFILFIASVVLSFMFLRTTNYDYERKAMALTSIGILFGILGLVTGAIWAKHTWGAYWSFDVKQNMTAIALLIYLAYFVLRNSFEDEEKRARVSAVYNIFAFATMIPLLYVIPKLTDSLHPGSGGNLPIGSLDLDSTMRMVFYPAIIGWTLLGVWMAQLILRTTRLRDRLLEF